MATPLRILHSHTHSMRLLSGAEALVVRVRVESDVSAYGFTFNEDVSTARAMAAWQARASASGLHLAALLGETARSALLAAAPQDAHPWARGWRDMLAGTCAAIDWNAEPGFAGLVWAEPILPAQ